MATDNPKISAYVPQTVYDRFNQFKEENDLSMSQAVIKILSEYFNIPLSSDISKEFTSSLPSRLESFDAQLSDLKRLYILLSERVDSIQSTNELLINMPIISNGGLPSELPSNPLNNEVISTELVGSISSELPLNTSVDGELNSGSLSVPRQIPLIESIQDSASKLLDGFKSNPVQTKLLAARLKTQPSTISNKRKELLSFPQEFFDWLQGKDPDHIRWISIGIDRVKGYVPADDTPLEKLESFQRWLKPSV